MTPFILLSLISIFRPSLGHCQEIFEMQPSSAQTTIAHLKRSNHFPTLSMLAQYRGEEKKGVRYLTHKEQQAHLLHICDGLLCDVQGLPLNSKFTGPKEPLKVFPKFLEDRSAESQGYAIYVMDAKGQIYVSFEAKPKKFHHSSLLAGQAVAAAGEVIIFQGQLYAINNQSGHYQPPPIVIKRVLSVLKAGGVSTQGVLVKHFGSDF